MHLYANAPIKQWVVSVIGAVEVNTAQIEVITTETIRNLGHVLVETIGCAIGCCVKGEQLVLVGVDAVGHLVGMQLISIYILKVDVEVKACVATLIAAVKEVQSFGIGRNSGNSISKGSKGCSPLNCCYRLVIAPNSSESVGQ